jgi:LAS superfamily LD-carboxypeptidase LdcB
MPLFKLLWRATIQKMTLVPEQKHFVIYGVLGVALCALIGGTAFLYRQNTAQEAKILMLLEERNYFLLESASTTRTLLAERELASSTITELSSRLSLTAEELSDIERDLRREKNRNEEFEEKINDLAGTIGVLDKLSKTDEELLQKYSRTYFLNENFIPMKLSLIPEEYLMDPARETYFHGDAMSHLKDMLDAAKRAGHDIKVVSAFRSFDEQREVKTGHTIVYGSGANAFSADQGYSEHQLGTTVDIVDTTTRTLTTSFAATAAYAWLLDHAHEYGFILSYPEGNPFFIFEPWHWRFVGRSLAEDLHDDNQSFYNLDQRALDAYLIKIFD